MQASWERAIKACDTEKVRELLAGADIDALDRYGQSGLMLAAAGGCSGVVQALVEAGAALNLRAKYNLSALMLAVVNGHAEVVEILVQAGADRSIRGSGAPGFYEKTALDLAVLSGNEAIAALIRN